MSGPSFRAVDQHSGFVATCRRMVVETVEGAIVTVGEALLKRWDHDYDLPLVDERMQGRFESDGPDAADLLPDELWLAQQTSAVQRKDADGPAAVSVEQQAPAAGHPDESFDVGSPTRCWRCGSRFGVTRQGGDGGYAFCCLACGHPSDTSVGPPAAGDDPGPVDLPGAGPGSPTHAAVQNVLTAIAAQHRGFHVTHSTWRCDCGDELPQGDGILAIHERHIADHQAAAVITLFRAEVETFTTDVASLFAAPMDPLDVMAEHDRRIKAAAARLTQRTRM